MSLDGRHLAYTLQSGVRSQICVAELAGQELEQQRCIRDGRSPSWSSEGDLAFVHRGLRITRGPDFSRDVVLAASVHSGITSWSAGGRYIGVVIPGIRVLIIDAMTGDIIEEVDRFDDVRAIAWNPAADDEFVLARVLEDGSSVLFHKHVGHRRESSIEQMAQTVTDLAWSPDGRYLAYVAEPLPTADVVSELNSAEIWAIDRETSARIRLTANNMAEYGISWATSHSRR